MATAFKQLADNAGSTTATSMVATGVTSIVVVTGDGAKFPTPGNGFRVTLWNNVTYAEPGLDPQMEIVNVTARTTDTLTISATTKTHASPCRVDLFVTSTALTDIHSAINTIEALSPTGTGAFTTYTPGWQNPTTIGNATVALNWTQINKVVFVRIKMTAGTTTVFSTTAPIVFSLPTSAATGSVQSFAGACYIEDAGVTGYQGSIQINDTTTAIVLIANVVSTYATNVAVTGTAPFTWGTGDYFVGEFWYEAQ